MCVCVCVCVKSRCLQPAHAQGAGWQPAMPEACRKRGCPNLPATAAPRTKELYFGGLDASIYFSSRGDMYVCMCIYIYIYIFNVEIGELRDKRRSSPFENKNPACPPSEAPLFRALWRSASQSCISRLENNKEHTLT